jgi:hypothetical protein
MRTRRKTAIAAMTVVCSLAVAACGEQIAAHVQAGDTVHAALTSVLNSPTTRFVITAENLPGRASIADGSFSIVVTTSLESAQSSASPNGHRAFDISVYHETTNLVDLRDVNGTAFFRLDLKDLAAFGGAGSFASVSRELNNLATRPGLAYFHDILAGNWVGISTATLVAFTRQFESELAAGSVPTMNQQKIRQLRDAVATSLAQAVRTWLSIHQIGANEYALNLPIRGFVGSFVDKVATPLETYLQTYSKVPFPQAEITKVIDKIPANLSVHANVWVQSGSLSKVQIFIPDTSASVLIGISHPAIPVVAPTGATILTRSSLTDLYQAVLPGGLLGIASSSGLSSSLG